MVGNLILSLLLVVMDIITEEERRITKVLFSQLSALFPRFLASEHSDAMLFSSLREKRRQVVLDSVMLSEDIKYVALTDFLEHATQSMWYL